MTTWMRIDQFLNSRRMTYAWIAGGVLWIAWLLSTILGPGNMDMNGQVIGADYLPFYATGMTLREAHSADLYNFEYQSQMEVSIAGPELTSYHAFLNPPFLAWVFVPFTYLPYTWSFIAWSLLSLLCLWLSIKLLARDHPGKSLLWSLTWFPIFAAVSFGQNSLQSLFLFSLAFWLWKKDRHLAAGLVSSLLLIKPQMVLGIGLLWLLDWRKSWKSLFGLTVGGGILAGLCFWLLPDASWAYVNLVRTVLPGMPYQAQFPLWHLQSIRGFWISLFPSQNWLVEGLTLVLSAVGVVAFIYLWRANRLNKAVLFATAVCLTIWLNPHTLIYDWSILLLPALILWKEFPQLKPTWKALFFLIWIATFLSGPLTYMQLKILPVAIQVSIPVLCLVFVTLYKVLMEKTGNTNQPEVTHS